jgi:hypothetical protein
LSHGLLFILLVAPSRYGMAYCDGFSDFHLVSAGIGGLVLWAGLSMPVRRHVPRPEILVPLVAGAAVAIAAILLFPQCLADPMAALDPKLREFWLDKVIEAQNALQIAHLDPWLLVSLFSLPLMALAAGGWKILREFPRAAIMPALVFVLIATAVTAFQMRGTQFATPLSALALAILVTGFAETAGKDKPLQLAAALALSCVLVWKVITLSAIAVFSGGQSGPLINAAGAAGSASCEEPAALAPLAAEKPGTVAAANSIGPAILYYTPHRVLSGPYHRNVEGNLAWINAMLGSADEARAIFAKEGVTLLVLCPGDPDEMDFQAASPQGFAARLVAGTVPDWLEPVPVSQKSPLSLFRIKR